MAVARNCSMETNDVINWVLDNPPAPITSDFNGDTRCNGDGKWWHRRPKHQWRVFAGRLHGNGLYWRMWRLECKLCGQFIQRPSAIGYGRNAGCVEYSPFHRGLHYSQCEHLPD